MKYYTFNYVNKEGVEKELRLRLTSAEAMDLESTKKMSLMEFLQQESMGMIVTMLRYLRKWEDKNFSLGQAQILYDELIDSGMTMKSILLDIIYESLVVSGFLEKNEWEEVKSNLAKAQKETKKILMEQ